MDLPNPVAYAIPVFILLLAVEIIAGRRTGRARYTLKDASASLTMGLGYVIIATLLAGVFGTVYALTYEHRLFDFGFAWWAFPAAFLLDDFLYYWWHRWSHEVRWFWANHVGHHSSRHYNLSTALRQPWTSTFTGLLFLWVPMVWLGFHPLLIAFVGGLNLVYQFWIHTEMIRRMPRWFEAVFNTPSHHRVHHATNPRYIDANYAGVFIIWDRLFGTFVAERDDDPCTYGIIKNLKSHNPLVIAFHEWAAIFRDWFGVRSAREWWGYTFGPPGWSPDGSRMTSAQLKEEWRRTSAEKHEAGQGTPV
jgi:sterol desaturase/sphingolipid hydroxylase (fatty acid hydroxylase superfamily)